jgi:hypothetical protein
LKRTRAITVVSGKKDATGEPTSDFGKELDELKENRLIVES